MAADNRPEMGPGEAVLASGCDLGASQDSGAHPVSLAGSYASVGARPSGAPWPGEPWPDDPWGWLATRWGQSMGLFGGREGAR